MHYLLLLVIPLMPLQNVVEKIPKGPTGINFFNIVTLLLIGGWFLSCSRERKPFFEPNSINAPLMIFIGLNFLALWRSSFYLDLDLPFSLSDQHVIFFKDFATSMAFFWFSLGILHSEKHMRWLLIAMGAILPYMFRVHYSQLQAASGWHYDHDMRVTGTFMHLGSNELAAFYTQYGMIFMSMIFFLKERWQRIYFLAVVGLCLWGTVYSYSRASYIAILVSLLIFGFVRSRLLILGMIGFVFVAPVIMPRSVMDRIEMTRSTDGELDESAASRLDFWELAWERFLDFPLQGTGLHSFHHYNPAGLDTHNLYVRQMVELGVFGILLFMILYVVAIRECIKLYKEADTPFLKGLALGMVLCIVSNMILNIFGDRGSHMPLATYYWVGMGMVVRGRQLVRDREGPERSEADPDATTGHNPAPKVSASIFAERRTPPPDV